MKSQRKIADDTRLPDSFRNELARLVRAGLPLLPLGSGADGKGPMLKDWAGARLPLGRVLAPLYRSGSMVYGIRLDGLAVIDCDFDSDVLVAKMEARFGVSPVHVKTPRGRHLYYRAAGIPPNLRAEGLPIDVKTGARAYVVGPHSQRPDGGLYVPAKGVLGVDSLPPLTTLQKPEIKQSATIAVGNRHCELIREAIAMVQHVDSAEELTANLLAFRDDLCQDIGTFPDREVQSIAAWTWSKRLANSIYRGRNSAFSVDRQALDVLRRWDNETDAIGLYVLLKDMHGHSPGKRFALDFAAMREAGLTRLSVPRLRAARRTLQAVGLVKLVGKHKAGAAHQTFTMSRMHPDAANVTSL